MTPDDAVIFKKPIPYVPVVPALAGNVTVLVAPGVLYEGE